MRTAPTSTFAIRRGFRRVRQKHVVDADKILVDLCRTVDSVRGARMFDGSEQAIKRHVALSAFVQDSFNDHAYPMLVDFPVHARKISKCRLVSFSFNLCLFALRMSLCMCSLKTLSAHCELARACT